MLKITLVKYKDNICLPQHCICDSFSYIEAIFKIDTTNFQLVVWKKING